MRSLAARAGLLFAGAALAGSAAAQELATLSDEQLRVVQRGLAGAQQQFRPLDDAVLQGYLGKLGARLGASERIYMAFTDERAVNAVAMVGDVIMLHAGMALFTSDQNQLAGVLAHEIAHVSQEHFTRLPGQVDPYSKLALGSFLVALLASPQIADEVLISSQAISGSLTFETIRRYEREADQLAIRTLIASGFDPAAYISLIEDMAQASTAGLPEYLSTHPISANRISDLQGYIRNISRRPASEPVARAQLDYWLIRARLRHLTSTSYRKIQVPAAQAPVVAAYARLLERLPASEDAPELAANAANWIVAVELGEALAATGEHARAERILADALAQDPANPALLGALLNVHAKAQDRVKAVKLLARLSESMRLDPAVVAGETQLWFELDEQLRYEVAVAYGQYLQGNLEGARARVAELQGRRGDESSNRSALARLELLDQKIRLLLGSS